MATVGVSLEGRESGALTFPCANGGGSMIDLCLASPGLYGRAVALKVGAEYRRGGDATGRPFSDHLPVSLTLNLPVSNGVRAAAVQSRPARVRFDVRGWRRYSAAFAADDAAALAALQDVKEALELGEVNSTIAVERISGIVAKEMIKVFGRRRPAGLAQEDATWWNAECQQARDTMRERDAARGYRG
ncbi:hypothetical protein TSOC_011380 [Tetrabaena socialis]|uniref:Endonuclease/exonuclease/phosphatase domain-containing protein n=1 Tax=Tetrabaena socialis TaxID=47790 RepID=A0A2J7ZQU0_9CHLO|nr:hypothetical protein TSOC_011380 [Tetrabaena socialis]|eukprot:PNH02634.1 hypothetical protein TSOC_011380 [Tetrabaena socialis]